MSTWLDAPIQIYAGAPPAADPAASFSSWNPGTFVKMTLIVQVVCMLLYASVWSVYELVRWRNRTRFVDRINGPAAAAAGPDLKDLESGPLVPTSPHPIKIKVNNLALHYDSDALIHVLASKEILAGPAGATTKPHRVMETRPIQISSPYLEDFVCVILEGLDSLRKATGSWEFVVNKHYQDLWLATRPYAALFESYNRTTFVWTVVVGMACQMAFVNLLSVCGVGSSYRYGYHPDLHPIESHPGETWWLKHAAFFLLLGESAAAVMLSLHGTVYWYYALLPFVSSGVVAASLAIAGSVIGGRTSVLLFLPCTLTVMATNAVVYLFILPRVAAMVAGKMTPGASGWLASFKRAKEFLEIQSGVTIVYVFVSVAGSDGIGILGESATLFVRTLCEFFVYSLAFAYLVVVSNGVEASICKDILLNLGFRSACLEQAASPSAIRAGLDACSGFYSTQDEVFFQAPDRAKGISGLSTKRTVPPPPGAGDGGGAKGLPGGSAKKPEETKQSKSRTGKAQRLS